MAPPTSVVGLQAQHDALRRVTRLITRQAELEAVFDTVVSGELTRVLGARTHGCCATTGVDKTTVLAAAGNSAFSKGSPQPREDVSLLGSSLTYPSWSTA